MKGCAICVLGMGEEVMGGEWMGTGANRDNIVFSDRKTMIL